MADVPVHVTVDVTSGETVEVELSPAEVAAAAARDQAWLVGQAETAAQREQDLATVQAAAGPTWAALRRLLHLPEPGVTEAKERGDRQ